MTYTLNLDQQTVGLIYQTLRQLPHAQVDQALLEISRQVSAQDAERTVTLDASGGWETSARQVLSPEDFARLQAAVGGKAALSG